MSETNPCPVCGAPSQRVADLTRCAGECGLTLASADFARLSQAARLLAAVERLDAEISKDDMYHLSAHRLMGDVCHIILTGRTTPKHIGPLKELEAPTLAAALIALGESND